MIFPPPKWIFYFQGLPGENGEKGNSVFILGAIKGIPVSFMIIVSLKYYFSAK